MSKNPLIIPISRLEIPKNLSQKQLVDKREEYFEAFIKIKKEFENKFQEKLEMLREIQSLARKKKDAEDRMEEIYDRLRLKG